jgi:hypothetical protein
MTTRIAPSDAVRPEGIAALRIPVSLAWRFRRRAITLTGDLQSGKEGRLYDGEVKENNDMPDRI